MTDDVKADLKKYEKIVLEIRELEELRDVLKEKITPELEVGAKIETDQGMFTIEQHRKWSYTPETEAREKSLKETKKAEEANGRAKALPGKAYLVYREKKDALT